MILKKKIIASWAILSLSMIPILTIATGSTGTTTNSSPASSTKIPKVGHWQKAAGSKLTSGERGKFFQARNGDLYVMGKGTGLEVLKKGEAIFKPALGSITRDGEFGTIFQAQNGDIYVMGKGTRLEVLKNGSEEFEVVTSSNIDNGKEGTIFQVKNGDIYTMGIGKSLQVLKNGASAFTPAPGSITTSGYEGHFFQAQNGDLYVGGWKTNLEVLKKGTNQFAKASGSKATNGAGMRFLQTQNGDLYILHEKGLEVLKKGEAAFKTAPGSITTNGAFGIIFQAQNGDIYVMGHNTKLEVLKNGASSFTIAHGSHISNGRDGNIFETWNGDIYAMGKGTGLEVLKKGTSTFVSAPGSKIQNGSYGQFFEAQNGDLYVVSQYSTLEVLKFGANTFQRARGSKINTGLFAKIFQARNGDIYTMGYNAPLQVLKKGEDKFKDSLGSSISNGRLGRFFQAQNGDIYAMADSGLEVLKGEQLEFALNNETSSGNNDGQITLTNYKNQFSKLQYRKEGSATWDDVPSSGIISNLSPGLYEFQWVAKDGFQYDESTTSIEIIYEKQLIASAEVIDIPIPPTFTSTKEITSDANNGTITVTNFANSDSQLQYRQTLIKDVWKDVPSSGQINDLSPGEYAFRWKSKNYQYYKGTTSTLAIIEQKQMVVSADTTNIPISPTFYKTGETIKGLNDGKIIVRNLLQKYPNLDFVYLKGYSLTSWKKINSNGIIENLEIGQKKYYGFPTTARMLYDGLASHLRKDDIERIFKPRRIDTEYDENQNPTKYKVILKSYFEENDHWLQYKKTSSSKWKNVLSSGIIDNLSPGVYQFRWKSKKMQTYEDTLQPTRLIEESFTILEGTNILVPLLPNFQVAPETTSGGNDGIITITNFTNANSKLQYRKEGTPTWTDVPSNGIIGGLIPGGYEFQWTSKNNSELYDETRRNTYALKKQVVPSYVNLNFEINKFNDFKSTRAINMMSSNMKTKGNEDIKDDFINIPGYIAPILASGVSIKKVVVFAFSDRVVTYTVTLGKTGASDISKNVVVTYEDIDIETELSIYDSESNKFSNFDSPTPFHEVASHMKTKGNKDIKDDFIRILGYIAPNLGNGVFIKRVTVSQVLYSNRTTKQNVYYEILLAKDGSLNTFVKSVIVTYEIYINFEANKFFDFESTRAINAVPSNMKTLSNNDIKEDFVIIPGYIAPNLLDGVAIKKVVVFAISDQVITYKVTLGKWHGFTIDYTIEKNIIVTYGEATLSAAIAKFVDFSSTRAINAVPSNMKTASPNDIKDEFARIPDYNAPSLAAGISISKVIVASVSGNVVTYTITVAKSSEFDNVDVVVTYGEAALSAATAKFQDFSSTQNAKDLKESLKAKNEDSSTNNVKKDFIDISGLEVNLSSGFELTNVIVKTAYNEDTRQVVYTLTISKDGTSESVDHDITITFAPNWTAELEKIKDFVTTDNITTPIALALVDPSVNIKDAFMKIGNYESPDFASGVEIKKVVVKTELNENTRQVIYTLTLWDGTHPHPTTKDVIVTFAPNWNTALAKFVDFETTDNVESVAAILKATTNVDIKNEFEGITRPTSGYTKPSFSKGVAISKVVVKTKLNENTRQVVYTITLKNGDHDHPTTKDVVVTFKHTLVAEANRIKDFVTSDGIAVAKTFVKSEKDDRKAEFMAISNYSKIAFANSISILKVVVETAYDPNISELENTRQVVFKVTLEENNNDPKIDNPTIDKLVTVTFKPNFAIEEDKLTKKSDGSAKEFSSKKGTYSKLAKKQKNEDVTKLFINSGGIEFPKFAPGVSIKYVIVKTKPNANRKATYDVTLTDTRTNHGPFAIVIQFASDLDASLNDLNDFASSDDTKSDAAMLDASDQNVQETFEAINGFIKPTFAEGVTITKAVVKTKLNIATRQVVYEITLEKDNGDESIANESKKKQVTVTFATDLNVESNKFSDFSTSDNDKSDAAVLSTNDKDVQETFKAITGYEAPQLEKGVSIKKIIVKNALNDSRQVKFTITLGFGNKEVEKDVTVTFAPSPSQVEDTALTTSQIVGIAIGSIIGVGILGYLIYYLIKKRK